MINRKVMKQFLKNIIGGGKRALDGLRPGNGKGGRDKDKHSGKLTNKLLLQELKEHFEFELEELSVGKKMLYPMYFNVLMHPDDYSARKDSLPFILPEIVSAFYAIIDDKRAEYPDFTPPSRYWVFQFSACQMVDAGGGTDEANIVQKGHLTTLASLVTINVRGGGNRSVENNTHVSVKCQNSDVMSDTTVNWNAIKSLDFISEGTFTYNFDDKLNQDVKSIKPGTNNSYSEGYATLSYNEGASIIHYTMLDNSIYISGNSDDRDDRAIMKIDSDKIAKSHVQIKYSKDEKRFKIAAFANTRLNGKRLDISGGGDIKWYMLANKSNIFLNEDVNIEFEINSVD